MRVPCCFADRVPQSRYPMWRFGWVLDDGGEDPAVNDMVERALNTGYRMRKRGSPAGCALLEPDTHVEPFAIQENSLLAANPT